MTHIIILIFVHLGSHRVDRIYVYQLKKNYIQFVLKSHQIMQIPKPQMVWFINYHQHAMLLWIYARKMMNASEYMVQIYQNVCTIVCVVPLWEYIKVLRFLFIHVGAFSEKAHFMIPERQISYHRDILFGRLPREHTCICTTHKEYTMCVYIYI